MTRRPGAAFRSAIGAGVASVASAARHGLRDLEEDVKARLKRRAARHGRSMEEEIRHILRDAVKTQSHRPAKLGSRIGARFAKTGLDFDLPEVRGEEPRLTTFPE